MHDQAHIPSPPSCSTSIGIGRIYMLGTTALGTRLAGALSSCTYSESCVYQTCISGMTSVQCLPSAGA